MNEALVEAIQKNVYYDVFLSTLSFYLMHGRLEDIVPIGFDDEQERFFDRIIEQITEYKAQSETGTA